MRGANFGSGQARPPCIIPARGQVPENGSEPTRNNSGDVFQEEEFGSYSIGDAQDLPIKSGAFPVDPIASTGNANILARESRMQAIHAAGVFGWVEQPDITFVHPHAGEPSIGGTGSQDGAGVGVPLDGKDGGMSEDEIGVRSAAPPLQKGDLFAIHRPPEKEG